MKRLSSCAVFAVLSLLFIGCGGGRQGVMPQGDVKQAAVLDEDVKLAKKPVNLTGNYVGRVTNKTFGVVGVLSASITQNGNHLSVTYQVQYPTESVCKFADR